MGRANVPLADVEMPEAIIELSPIGPRPPVVSMVAYLWAVAAGVCLLATGYYLYQEFWGKQWQPYESRRQVGAAQGRGTIHLRAKGPVAVDFSALGTCLVGGYLAWAAWRLGQGGLGRAGVWVSIGVSVFGTKACGLAARSLLSSKDQWPLGVGYVVMGVGCFALPAVLLLLKRDTYLAWHEAVRGSFVKRPRVEPSIAHQGVALVCVAWGVLLVLTPLVNFCLWCSWEPARASQTSLANIDHTWVGWLTFSRVPGKATVFMDVDHRVESMLMPWYASLLGQSAYHGKITTGLWLRPQFVAAGLGVWCLVSAWRLWRRPREGDLQRWRRRTWFLVAGITAYALVCLVAASPHWVAIPWAVFPGCLLLLLGAWMGRGEVD